VLLHYHYLYNYENNIITHGSLELQYCCL